ncbi:MAG: MerR family transcriptional regulator [Thermoleophilaceae bacterium]|nr:MerR family transcriptional regulator [Thermoleophilaceae bacterium]
MGANGSDQFTIDELARRAGMTVRNIRAHQSRGLLPPPEVRARTGYYGAEHLARINLIQELQAEGFNLKAIQRLVETTNGSSQELLDFRHALLSSFDEEEPEFATAEELAARLGGAVDVKSIRKAEKLGLIRSLGDDRFEVPSPTLLRAGQELMALGIPFSHILAVAEQIERHSRAIADAFVRLFVSDVMGGRADPGAQSSEELAKLHAALQRLGPLATDAVRAGFQQTMGRAVEQELQKELRR